jgi:hypothetical protein
LNGYYIYSKKYVFFNRWFLVYSYRSIRFCLYGFLFIIVRIILAYPIWILICMCLWFICLKERSLYFVLSFCFEEFIIAPLKFTFLWWDVESYWIDILRPWIFDEVTYIFTLNMFENSSSIHFKSADSGAICMWSQWVASFLNRYWKFENFGYPSNLEWGWEVPSSNKFIHMAKVYFNFHPNSPGEYHWYRLYSPFLWYKYIRSNFEDLGPLWRNINGAYETATKENI